MTADDVRRLVSRFRVMAHVLKREINNLRGPYDLRRERIADLALSTAEAATTALRKLKARLGPFGSDVPD